jgi:hypothetical protein
MLHRLRGFDRHVCGLTKYVWPAAVTLWAVVLAASPAEVRSVFIQSRSAIVDARQKDSLRFETPPPLGSQVTVLVSIYDVLPPDGLITDNNGHAYVRDVYKSPDDPANTNDGGVAIYHTTVTSNRKTPFTVTLDNSARTADDSWFTWAIANHRGQDPASPLDATAADGGRETQFPSPGTLAATTPDGIVFSVLSKRAHANDTITAPKGWTLLVNNPENSAHQSGAAAYAILTARGDVTPVWSLANLDGPSFRCVAAIYKAASGEVGK